MATAAELILTSSGRPINLGSFDDFARTSANQFDQSKSVASTLRGLQRVTAPPARFEIVDESASWPALPPRLHAPSPILYMLNVRYLVARGAPVTLAALGALLWLIGRRAR